MKQKWKMWAALFTILQAADAFTTYIVIKNGIGTENNPIVASTLHAPLLFLSLKLLLAAFVTFGIYLEEKKHHTSHLAKILNTFYIIIFTNNLIVIAT